MYNAVTERHLEIMPNDLSEIFYDATRDAVSMCSVTPSRRSPNTGDVTFEHGEPRGQPA
ncbi:MAG: hypothetical protein ACR2G2_10000 [Pseudonocardia sp.]